MAIIRANWLPKVRLVGFLGIKVICAPVLSVSLYPVGEWGILVSTEILESPDGPLADMNGPCRMNRLPCPLGPQQQLLFSL